MNIEEPTPRRQKNDPQSNRADHPAIRQRRRKKALHGPKAQDKDHDPDEQARPNGAHQTPFRYGQEIQPDVHQSRESRNPGRHVASFGVVNRAVRARRQGHEGHAEDGDGNDAPGALIGLWRNEANDFRGIEPHRQGERHVHRRGENDVERRDLAGFLGITTVQERLPGFVKGAREHIDEIAELLPKGENSDRAADDEVLQDQDVDAADEEPDDIGQKYRESEGEARPNVLPLRAKSHVAGEKPRRNHGKHGIAIKGTPNLSQRALFENDDLIDHENRHAEKLGDIQGNIQSWTFHRP